MTSKNPGMRKPMISAKRIGSWVVVCLFSICVITGVAPAQSKTEREHKPVEQQPATPNANADADKDKSDEDPEFKGLEYRLIGPFRGGRSLTAAGVPGDPTTYFFGSTGGGVWKSTDGAMTWSPVFDKQSVSAIGSLAVATSDPNIIYVGTGEACIRGNISHGDGVYKSVDGG